MPNPVNRDRPNDPYAPPPRHKDKSGVVVRVVMAAALLGGAALAYTHYSSQTPAVDMQQMAELEPSLRQDGSYAALPMADEAETAPDAAGAPAPTASPAEAAPEPAPVPAPADTPVEPLREQW